MHDCKILETLYFSKDGKVAFKYQCIRNGPGKRYYLCFGLFSGKVMKCTATLKADRIRRIFLQQQIGQRGDLMQVTLCNEKKNRL